MVNTADLVSYQLYPKLKFQGWNNIFLWVMYFSTSLRVFFFFFNFFSSRYLTKNFLWICTWLLVSLTLCNRKDPVFLEIFETDSWWAIELLMLLDICFDSCSVLSLIIFIMVCSSFFPPFHFCLLLTEDTAHRKPDKSLFPSHPLWFFSILQI